MERGETGRDAYDAVRQRATEAVDACGLFTPDQTRALLSDPSWEVALRMGSEHADALARCEAARGDFVTAARALLAPDGDNDADADADADADTGNDTDADRREVRGTSREARAAVDPLARRLIANGKPLAPRQEALLASRRPCERTRRWYP